MPDVKTKTGAVTPPPAPMPAIPVASPAVEVVPPAIPVAPSITNQPRSPF
jgi:hypothetical protein